jgi:hypothetical protein
MKFQNHRLIPVSVFRVKIAASEPLKRVTTKDLELVSNFIEGRTKLATLKRYENY